MRPDLDVATLMPSRFATSVSVASTRSTPDHRSMLGLGEHGLRRLRGIGGTFQHVALGVGIDHAETERRWRRRCPSAVVVAIRYSHER